MSDKEVLLTPEGLEKLEKELEYLKTVARREVAEHIKQALEFGDISENSEYEDAKNEQAFIEGRIATVEKILRNARVINETATQKNVVSLGSKVKLKDLETGEIHEYWLVGSAESDPVNDRISNEAPVGKAILGKKVGTVVDVAVPDGVIQYQIMEVSHH
ncbi:MAG: transcription elongation factor GreA [Betaproteobacteria bacterium]